MAVYYDQISINRVIEGAHPKLRDELLKIYHEANNRLGKTRLRFAYVLRTFNEQTALYSQGRSKKGSVVTNAKAGQSYHNYGLAVDIVLLVDKDGNGTYEAASWDVLKDWDCDGMSDWMEVVAVFKKYGWEWGGDWRFKDLPHFEKRFGIHWSELLKRKGSGKVDKNGFVLI